MTKSKFEIHLQYTFAPFFEVIKADKMSYGGGIVTAVSGDTATQVFPSSDVIIKKVVQNFGWNEDAKAYREGFQDAMNKDKDNGNAGVV